MTFPNQFQPGQQINSPAGRVYTIKRLAGEGGEGRVYEAVIPNPINPKVFGRFALKHFFTPPQFDENILKSLYSHPNIPLFSEAFSNFHVYGWVYGKTLDQCEYDNRLFLHFKPVLLESLEAVGLLHTKFGIIHRDIKPTNIMRDEDGSIKLLDLGISKPASTLTQTWGNAATIIYSPLEQFGTNQSTNERSDIYSLGATFYRLLSGLEPTSAPDRAAGDNLTSLSVLRPDIMQDHPNVISAIEKAMEIYSRDRHPSVQAFIESLEPKPIQVNSGATIPLSAVNPPQQNNILNAFFNPKSPEEQELEANKLEFNALELKIFQGGTSRQRAIAYGSADDILKYNELALKLKLKPIGSFGLNTSITGFFAMQRLVDPSKTDQIDSDLKKLEILNTQYTLTTHRPDLFSASEIVKLRANIIPEIIKILNEYKLNISLITGTPDRHSVTRHPRGI